MTADDPPDLPVGPDHVCFDATVLIHYQDNGHLDTLRDLFDCRRFTANTIPGFELVKTEKARQLNQRILNATWLEPVAVSEPADLVEFEALLGLWGGPPGKNEGEAEVVLLCERHGWIGIIDDWQGRNEAHLRGKATIAYMSTMLLAAAAIGINGLDVDQAWDIHRAVESRRKRPRLPDERIYKRLVPIFAAAYEQNGRPAWPRFLTDPRLDQLVDRADPLSP